MTDRQVRRQRWAATAVARWALGSSRPSPGAGQPAAAAGTPMPAPAVTPAGAAPQLADNAVGRRRAVHGVGQRRHWRGARRVELQGRRGRPSSKRFSRDERYAPAHAGAGPALVRLAAAGGDHPDRCCPRPLTTRDRAIELDPTLALGGSPRTGRGAVEARLAARRDALPPRDRAGTRRRRRQRARASYWLATGRSDEALHREHGGAEARPPASALQASTGLVHRFAGRMH